MPTRRTFLIATTLGLSARAAYLRAESGRKDQARRDRADPNAIVIRTKIGCGWNSTGSFGGVAGWKVRTS